tara:strand:- start:1187 stop:3061 length:1875 start_codon:yes stop_codon:yes gene_type:complete
MLDIVRNLVSSIFGKILLGLMVLSFALWGVGDILSSGNSKLAAKVGNQKISLEEFYNKFGRKVQELNLSTGDQLTIQEAHEQNIDKLIINDLVYEKMVLEFANRNKIYITDNILKETIKSLPQFIGTNGKFSEQLYKNSIKRNFSSEEEFLNELTFVYINSLLFENFKSGDMTNQKIIELLYEYEGEERSIKYFIFNDKNITIETSEDDVKKYYNENKSKYLTDEKRTIEYLSFNLNHYKKLTSFPDDKVLNYYNENKDLFFKEEKRSVELVRFQNKENAEKFHEKWLTSNTKEIKKYIQDNNITVSEIDDLTRDSFETNVTNEIFKLEKDSIGSPIKISDAGYYVVKVTAISPEIQQTFKAVKQEILDEMSYSEAYDLYDQALNYADELLLSGYDLYDVAENLDLRSIVETNEEIIKTSKLDKFIQNQKNKDLFSDAYKQITNYTSDIIIDDETAYIYKIINIEEPFIQEFNNIKNQVSIDLKNHRIQKIMDEAANQFLVEYQFKNYDEFKNYVSSNKIQLLSLDNIKRNSTGSPFKKSTIEEIFSLNEGNILKFKDSLSNIGVIYIKDVTSPKDKISNEFYYQVLKNIKLNYDLSIENIFGESIIEESTYEIFLQNIDNIFS